MTLFAKHCLSPGPPFRIPARKQLKKLLKNVQILKTFTGLKQAVPYLATVAPEP